MVLVKSALIPSQSDTIPSSRRIHLIVHLFVVIWLVTFAAKVAQPRNTRTTHSQTNTQHSSTVQPGLSYWTYLGSQHCYSGHIDTVSIVTVGILTQSALLQWAY